MEGQTVTFPSGAIIQTCMNSAGVSTGCSQCWANLFDGVKTCFVDTCGFDVSSGPASGGPPAGMNAPSQQCIDCLTNLSNQFSQSDTTVCGIDPAAGMGGSMSENIRSQIGNWIPRQDPTTTSSAPTTTTSGKSVSLRSITTSALLFALLFVAI